LICIGVDPGQKRVGIALGQGELAIGIKTVDRATAVAEVLQIAEEKSAARIYVGKPTSLGGGETKSTTDAAEFAISSVPVFMLDERLTSTQSQRNLRETGHSVKSSRHVIDAEAARLIVELAIACKHNCGEAVGQSA
jgi:putative transcription antitermination factor YqgF